MNDILTSKGAELATLPQLLNLANKVGLEVGRYLISSGATKYQIQALPDEKAKEIAREIVHRYLQLVPESVQAAKELLAKFFQEVFGLKIDLGKIAFPTREEFSTFMAVPPQLSEDQIMEAYKKKWGTNLFRWKEPAASEIDRKSEQKRPSGLYVFAHRGGDETDQSHLGKSYDDAVAASMIFMNDKEYLLATGFHRFAKERFMDVKGCTRTSSLWSDGDLVLGSWDPGGSGLCLDNGNRDYRNYDSGPRELVFS